MPPFIKRFVSLGKKLFIIAAAYTIVAAAFIAFSNPRDFALKTADFEKNSAMPLYQRMYDPANNKTKDQRAMNEAVKFAACRTVGELCTPNQIPGDEKYFRESAMGGIAKFIATPYVNPPASGVYWAQEQLQRAGLAPKTYAAEGIGLAGIRPFARIWTMFRNVTYLLLTVLVVGIGLLIMLRFKINPQTVITLENALPRIVITIILISFSFPIAGFMIDLMYAVMLAGVSIFAVVDPQHFNAGELNRNYVTAGLATLWEGFFPSTGQTGTANPLGQFVGLADLGSSLIDVLPGVIGFSLRAIGSAAITYALANVALKNDGFMSPLTKMLDNVSFLGFGAGTLPYGILYYGLLAIIFAVTIPFTLTFGGGWILAVIIWLTLLALFFRIIVMLFASYLRIILYVIFSPFIILTTAIPGRNGFSYWLRSLAGELSVFPTVVFLLLVGRLIVMAFTLNDGQVPIVGGGVGSNPGNFFQPGTGQGVWTPPFLWGISQRSLAIIIGMQIIFLIPDLARLVRGKLSGSKGLPFSTGAGVFFAGISGVGGGGMGMASKYHTLSLLGGAIPGVRNSPLGKKLGLGGHSGMPGPAAHKAPAAHKDDSMS